MDETRSSPDKIYLKNIGEEAGVKRFTGMSLIFIGHVHTSREDEYY